MLCDIGEVCSLANGYNEIGTAPERRHHRVRPTSRRLRYASIAVTILDSGLRADVKHEAIAASLFICDQDFSCEPVGKDQAFAVLFCQLRWRESFAESPSCQWRRVDEWSTSVVCSSVVCVERIADSLHLLLGDDDRVRDIQVALEGDVDV